jgi:hypothetical protein
MLAWPKLIFFYKTVFGVVYLNNYFNNLFELNRTSSDWSRATSI